jgi:DNA polymerase III epsilon subunit-like protein
MARAAWPTARHHLRACCSHAHIRARGFHTALGDARATAKLLSWFLAHDRCSGIAEIADGAASLNWPSPPRAAVACYPRRAGLRTSRALASLLSQLFAKRANGAQTKPSSAAAREVSTSSSSA